MPPNGRYDIEIFDDLFIIVSLTLYRNAKIDWLFSCKTGINYSHVDNPVSNQNLKSLDFVQKNTFQNDGVYLGFNFLTHHETVWLP
jgi:hypothetical protein